MRASHLHWRALPWLALLLAAGCSSAESPGRTSPTGAAGFGSPAGTLAAPPRAGTAATAGKPLPPIGTAGAAGAAVGGRGGPVTAGAPTTGAAGTANSVAGSGGKAATAGSGGATIAADGGRGGTGLNPTEGRGGSSAGTAGSSAVAGSGGTTDAGACCRDCICRGEVPAELTARDGPYRTATTSERRGTVHYPTSADPPFAALAIIPGFLNTGPEMRPWGEFYASWGIVTHVTGAGAGDLPETRAQLLLEGVEELKQMNMDERGPLAGKLSGRYGISGYSYGGGGATIGASRTPELATSIGLAPFGGSGRNSKVPTLVFCGEIDPVAACFMADGVYGGIPDPTPKMYISVPGAEHLAWFTPTAAGGGTSGKYALAFQKVFLEGDLRWKPLLMQKPASGDFKTNIQ